MDGEDAVKRRSDSPSSSYSSESSGDPTVIKEEQTLNPSASAPHHQQEAAAASKERTSPMKPPADSIPSSAQKDQRDQLEKTRSEMGEVMEENRRLKLYLAQIMKEYTALESKFHDIVQQRRLEEEDQSKKSTDSVEKEAVPLLMLEDDHEEQHGAEQLQVSLSLGRSPSRELKKMSNLEEGMKGSSSGSLSLTLDYSRFEGASNSSGEAPKEMSPTKPLPASSAVANKRSGEDDEVSQQQQNPAAKKARVSVRARCDTPTMNDGCQWRKYGQKIAKGNPCPRAYYRCTVGPTCPVRKQVQRCAEDMSILITTYEGNHNHPLPMSATAMASTTSAAASMLLSTSSSSTPTAAAAAAAANLNGLNYYINNSDTTNPFSSSSRPPFYFQTTNNNSYNSPYSPSPTCPTITLDLAASNSSNIIPPQSSSRFSSLPRFSPTPTTSLNFGSTEPPTTPFWGGGAGILNYGIGNSTSSNTTTSSTSTSTSSHRYNQPPYNYGMGRPTSAGPTPSERSLFMLPAGDHNSTMVAAATKAITADPSFQSALAAALTSIIGNGNSGANNISSNHSSVGKESSVSMMSSSIHDKDKSTNEAATASGRNNSQQLMFLPLSRSASASPPHNKDDR